jgi:phosphate transport system substrate-binding protein
MKTLKTKLLTFAGIAAVMAATAQTKDNGKVIITGTKFTFPLINEWIKGFQQKYPDVSIGILQKDADPSEPANLFISGHALAPSEIKTNYHLLKVARYAILPITNEQNPWLKTVASTGIDKEKMKSIFFKKQNEATDDHAEVAKKNVSLAIYTREQKGCAPIAFANYYNLKQENITGKQLQGDDKVLLQAITDDKNGITYNNLGYIYDLTTRKVPSPIAVVPIDQNGNGKLDASEKIYDNLDGLITAIESGKTTQIPVEYITLAVPNQISTANKNLKLFADYVLAEGQKQNRPYGFLGLLPQDNQQEKTSKVQAQQVPAQRAATGAKGGAQ